MPFYLNPNTKEPYLRLGAPHTNIIITPHRLDRLDEDIPPRVEMFNDPKIYMVLDGPPVPYLYENGVSWVKSIGEQLLPVVEAIQANPADPGVFGESPFSYGHPLEDCVIGDITITRYAFYEYPQDSEERTAAQNANKELPAGDESIAWGIGCFLSPRYHGQGIMTSALRTLIHDWAVPYMKARDIRASVNLGNNSSLRVFEKNDFEEVCTLKDWKKVSESRGGGVQSIVVVRWRGGKGNV
ncbi:hypothetical protein N7470_004666 [Penicillium chermesinum]|nr:hypothetical protein N7470_004666 [Penicillium chermesinum]